MAIVSQYIPCDKVCKAAEYKLVYLGFVYMLRKERGKACQETVREWLAVYPFDNVSGSQDILFQELVFQLLPHHPFQQVAFQAYP